MKFLVVTDLHSCKNKARTDRYYDLSDEKLRSIVQTYAAGCDFIVNLGDSAEAGPGEDQAIRLREISEILHSAGIPVYSVIGNHDTSLPNDRICEILGMPDRYYRFETPDYTCIVLDGNHNVPDIRLPGQDIIWDATYLDEEQLLWLARTVENAEKPVLVFCHELFVLREYENADDGLVLRNRDRALAIFEKSDKVRGVFCGHCHTGDFTRLDGIPYLTFCALCLREEGTCAVLTVEDGVVRVEGHGLEPSRSFHLRA